MRLPLPATLAIIALQAVSNACQATCGAIVDAHMPRKPRKPKAPAWLNEAREVREP